MKRKYMLESPHLTELLLDKSYQGLTVFYRTEVQYSSMQLPKIDLILAFRLENQGIAMCYVSSPIVIHVST